MKNKTAFIATVGIGTGPEADIVPALVKSIKGANPDYLYLIATPKSKENAERIIKELGMERNSQITLLPTIEDVREIFKVILGVLSDLIKKEIPQQNIILDYTTGTKAMSAAAVLAGIKGKVQNLKYISVKRDENRRVIPGTEKIIAVEPTEIMVSYSIDLVINLIKEFRFDSALRLLENIDERLLAPREGEVVKNLKFVAQAYDRWDKFDHKRFAGEYAKIRFNEPEIREFKVEEDIPGLVLGIGKNIEERKITEPVIVDLINNVRRRIKEGKFDDAIARLYRVVELIAQWRLKEKYDIETSDVNLERIKSEELKEELQAQKDPKDGKIKIGLKKDYKLLKAEGDELGILFDKNAKLQALLEERNNSILAHGLKPISEDLCRSLLNEVEKIAEKFVKEYSLLKERLKFPWE